MFRSICLFALGVCAVSAEQFSFSFEIPAKRELALSLELSSPGTDWGAPGREAAVGDVRLDEGTPQQVMLYTAGRNRYSLLFGEVGPGPHKVTIERNANLSAPGSGLKFHGGAPFELGSKGQAILANAPILYARQNTVGKFSDIPLLAYVERLKQAEGDVLQYTFVFSNEDGGTSTRALMARWGRTTDIEYVYRVVIDQFGKPLRGIVQAPGHRDEEYKGRREGLHPVLMPVTDNNMVAEAADSPLRFALAPTLVDLSNAAREAVMDASPFSYQVMARELVREDKLRPFGTVDGEKISDLRNYIFFEYSAQFQDAALAVAVHLKDGTAYSSDVGRLDYTIWRDGFVRTAVELPPGTELSQITGIEFRCGVAPPTARGQSLAHSGICRLQSVTKAFQLDKDYLPGPSFWQTTSGKAIPSGQSVTFTLAP